MTPLQYMILFTVIFGGKVMALPFNYGGSSGIDIITKQEYNPTTRKSKSKNDLTLGHTNKTEPAQKIKTEPDQKICLYSNESGQIFVKHTDQTNNKATYEVQNFALVQAALTPKPIATRILLPIYHGDRLGLILKQVRQTDPQESQPTKSSTPGMPPKPSTKSAKSSAAATQCILAFQKTTPNKEGLYEFDYLPLSEKVLNKLAEDSKNPTKVTEVRESNDTSEPKFVFTIKSFSLYNGSGYYFSLELNQGTQFSQTPAN